MSRVVIEVAQDWQPPIQPSDRRWATLSAEDHALLEGLSEGGGGDSPGDPEDAEAALYVRPDGSVTFLVDAEVVEEAFRREPAAGSISEALSRVIRWQAECRDMED